ncbi:hypothetical protein N7468_005330 [Penicillium chermesinum]|uniref:cellulase n=1 Tax=Penicillium chermesinum TaxID=63820 RepID=A0A9W9TPK6_9EURO|nr:uncharacterized protein N7468_005330 [Penicillium chermesinum]KAJ5232374.1 hypothetical protein N7468_005330 [Penicillium chermesinum]
MKVSNLILAASTASLAAAYPRGRPVAPSEKSVATKRANGLTWVGVSESGAEFGQTNLPGTLGKDYTWPDTTKIQVLRDAGMNIFRVPFLMERLVPGMALMQSLTLTTTEDSEYPKKLFACWKILTRQTSSGSIISSTSDFKTFWKNLATEFSSNEKVIFDTNNEYHDMDQTLVLNLNQAAIDGIRAAGATSQYIFAEGNAWTGAWSWTDNNDNMKGLTDSADKLIYEMHQYLDSDSSGTSENCVSTTIGQERLESATKWLKTNNKKGFIGEFAGGVNSVWHALLSLSDNSDVWTGASWWAAGPWWGSYMYSLEPTDGPAYSTYLPILEQYFVDGPKSASPSATSESTSSSAAPPATSTPNSQAQAPSPSVSTASSVPVAPVAQPTSFSSVPVYVPAPSSSSGFVSSSSVTPSATPSASSGAVRQYYQCGGANWTGPTTCQAPYTCKVQNPYYSQCL